LVSGTDYPQNRWGKQGDFSNRGYWKET
jgi:hypothetical protein